MHAKAIILDSAVGGILRSLRLSSFGCSKLISLQPTDSPFGFGQYRLWPLHFAKSSNEIRQSRSLRIHPTTVYRIILILLILLTLSAPSRAGENPPPPEEGAIITFWPFIDYRESPREGFSNLSILGPLFKLQKKGGDTDTALRPFFYRSESDDSSQSDYLYPVASAKSDNDGEFLQVLKLYQKRTPSPGEVERRGTMLFPFYISGTSEKHGPYTSVFPFYGDIYERFWRDEYHYVMFPLYGRTVKKGTETRNYLYPFFSLISGEKESGFHFWPLYGESQKEGVYRKRFALWPVFFQEETALDTDAPQSRFYLFPFYTSAESRKRSERHYLWPFFGYVSDREKKLEERHYFWPFVSTIRSESRHMDRYLPFFSEDRRKERVKRWYLWPFYSHEKLTTDKFLQERDRVLFFLYSDNRETWTADGSERRRTMVWPLLTYRKDERQVKTVTFPAPVEPILDKEGVEKNWAPLWRLYVQKWNDSGDSAVSFLWNLYWHEKRGEDLAVEFFPLLYYRSEKERTDLAFLKGLVRYRKRNHESKLSFFWLPFGVEWGMPAMPDGGRPRMDPRSGM
jgi:hypothetical protein